MLNACNAILYLKGMGSGIQAIDKTNELLSVMNVHTHDIYVLQIHERTIHRIFEACVILMGQYFHALITNLMTATWLQRF